ncbi:uncharacterized protein PV07_11680 [Cladophialophora immunda]|uniref:Cytochrome P450 n=1 Tax=Cladophialophora immunda TaxID=569365 RepID=A0A0D2AF21_9EURO|nr:uncharacterized protein PV07_11680 [Cladophialophora immunda]KIW23487.1 hypothetical protein PV07_11680 [Cladophialophora immunda]OQV01727.1 hypothetical protein CLAIMM_07028 [Cladophialophora immunda]
MPTPDKSAMIWLTTCIALLLGITLYYAFARKPRIHRHGHALRHAPDSLPLLGNAIQFLKPRHVLFDWFVKCQQMFGQETFEISVPSLPPGVVINSPQVLEYVLKNEAAITKGDFFRERSWDLFGYGIINASGELWRAQRKAGLKFFSGTNLDIMIEEVLPEIYHESTRDVLSQAAQERSVVDLQKIFHDLTTTVVGHMAYDMEIDATSPFSKAFDHASSQIGLRFQNPLYRITEIFTGSSFRAALIEVKRFGRQIVSEARKRRAREAFESLITNTHEEETKLEQQRRQPDNDDESGLGFGTLIDSLIESLGDPKIVADAALNFLSAGRDTTAQSFTWTFYALLRHPEVLKRLREEIDSKFDMAPSLPADMSPVDGAAAADVESEGEDIEIDVSALQPTSLPYTTAVFYESLRLYPPVPFEIKQTTQPVTLPDGTSLPAGAVVVWCIWALNRSLSTFGEDAHSFRPERWLEPSTSKASPPRSDGDANDPTAPPPGLKFTGSRYSAGEFPVFNGGPRSCLGKKMAELMGAWVLVRVLREWDFEEVNDGLNMDGSSGRRRSANSLTLPMQGGLPVRVTRRTARRRRV